MQTVGLVIAAGIFAGIAFLIFANQPKKKNTTKRQQGGLNKRQFAERWQGVEQTFSLGGPSNFKSAIMEADKLLDYALMSSGIRGNTLGERLKGAKSKFKNYEDYNNLWYAHKVRNSIAHDINHDLMAGEARKAMDYFRKALKELGVL